MPYIAPEIIMEAKRMDLLTYLKNYEPHELVRFAGNTYTTRNSRQFENFKRKNGCGGRKVSGANLPSIIL